LKWTVAIKQAQSSGKEQGIKKKSKRLLFDSTTIFHLERGPELSGRLWAGRTTRVRFPAGGMIGIFFIATASRPALGPTQPSSQWVLGALTP